MDKKYNPPMQNHSGQFAADAMREPHVTLLDHFAGLAMQTLLSNYNVHNMSEEDLKHVCEGSYIAADAMLKARKEVSGE